MADAAGAAASSTRLVHIGFVILTGSTVLASDIRKWHDKAEDPKSWPEFKTHFKNAQKAIKRSQPQITTDSLGFHDQANSVSVVDQVLAQLTAQRDAETLLANETAAERLAEEQTQQQITGMTNPTVQNQTMMDQMQTMLFTILTLQTKVNQGGRGGRG